MSLCDAKWIFFDMGYTLISEDWAHYARLEPYVGPMTDEMIGQFWETVDDCARNGARAPIPSAICRIAQIKKCPHYSRDAEEALPYSAEVLAELHTRYHIGVIANQSAASVKRLRRFGLLDHIDLVYSSEEIGKCKPDPAFFASAVRAAGVPADQCIMVGDRPDNDIAPAKAAGMLTVRVRIGAFRCREVTDPAFLPDADLPDIRALPELLGMR